jgi:hypothetical protein
MALGFVWGSYCSTSETKESSHDHPRNGAHRHNTDACGHRRTHRQVEISDDLRQAHDEVLEQVDEIEHIRDTTIADRAVTVRNGSLIGN